MLPRSGPTTQYHILLVERWLPDGCGMRWARGLLKSLPELHTVLLASPEGPALFRCASEAGFSYWLKKPLDFACCQEGLHYTGSLIREELNPAADGSNGNHALNACEAEVMFWLCNGLLYKEIEKKMNLSEAMVKKYQHSAYQKLFARKGMNAATNWCRPRQRTGRKEAPSSHCPGETQKFLSWSRSPANCRLSGE